MICRIEAGGLIAAYGQLKALLRSIHNQADQGRASQNPLWVALMPAEEAFFALKALAVIDTQSKIIQIQGIPTSCTLISQMINESNGRWNLSDLEDLISHTNNIVQQIPLALHETAIFALNKNSADLLDEEHPFGESVSDAFPSATFDIQEATRCKAYERWTASVLHLMRALETPIIALQNEVNVNVPKDQWEQMIAQIESKIKSMNKSTHTSADIQWFSEAAAHFRIIKFAWRNFAMHGKDSYDEQRSLGIYESVRSFITHLSYRLKE